MPVTTNNLKDITMTHPEPLTKADIAGGIFFLAACVFATSGIFAIIASGIWNFAGLGFWVPFYLFIGSIAVMFWSAAALVWYEEPASRRKFKDLLI